MLLEVKLGTAVNVVIDGHSALNGAVIPEGSTVAITSNDPTVAIVADVTVPAGGASQLVTACTLLAVGATDIHVVVTTPDGSIFEDTASLLVDPAAIPGLARISVTLVSA